MRTLRVDLGYGFDRVNCFLAELSMAISVTEAQYSLATTGQSAPFRRQLDSYAELGFAFHRGHRRFIAEVRNGNETQAQEDDRK